ncbi:hypothetical protein Tco_0199066 [Tanacetum coccineum]
MPVELGSFDVIIGMDWLRRCHAVIVCDEKLVQVPYGNETLTFCGNESSNGRESRLKVISCSKLIEYMAKGCQVFLAKISAKKEEDKSEGKQIKDVPIVRDFPKVFPEDLPGLGSSPWGTPHPPGLVVKRSEGSFRDVQSTTSTRARSFKDGISEHGMALRCSRVMPFGLTNALAVFMDLMNRVCKPYLDKFVIVFIEKLIISKVEKELEEHIKAIWNCLEGAIVFNKAEVVQCAQFWLYLKEAKTLWSIVMLYTRQGVGVDAEREGKANVVADALSQAQIEAQKPENLVNEDVGGTNQKGYTQGKIGTTCRWNLMFTRQELVALLWRFKIRDYA